MTRKPMPIARVALALVIVMSVGLSGLGGSAAPVGTAEAAVFQDCGISDSLLTAFLKGIVNPNGDGCRFNPDDSRGTESIDLYQDGQSLAATNDGFLDSYDNFGQDTRQVAWSKAKISIVNGLNDGNTSAVVAGEANTSVRDYYSQQQANLLAQYSNAVAAFNYTAGVDPNAVRGLNGKFGNYGDATATIELLNGSTVTINTFVVISGSGSRSLVSPFNGYVNGTGDYSNYVGYAGEPAAGGSWDVYVKAPSADYSDQVVIDMSRWYSSFRDISDRSKMVTQNVDSYTQEVYSLHEAGEINTTDMVDAGVLAGQAASDYNSTGYGDFASVSLATMGYASNFTSSFEVQYGNQTAHGQLFYTGDDLGSFENGTTYDPSALSGTVYLVEQRNESAELVRLTSNFTVSAITNVQTGEAMTNTTIVKKVYHSNNASKLQEEIQALQELREEYEKKNSGGSGFGFGKDGNMLILGVILALLAVSLLRP